jgi:hypothetical protein
MVDETKIAFKRNIPGEGSRTMGARMIAVSLSGVPHGDPATLHIPALQRTYSTGVGFDMATTGASIASKFRQCPKAGLAGE